MTDNDLAWTVRPPSPRPDIREMSHDDVVEAMVGWSFANYEDPAERTPWDEGEYVFICDGAYHARDERERAFGRLANDRAIATAIDRIE